MSLRNILSRRNRVLLRELVVTDFKLRYQGSVLGYVWSLLKPLMLFAILYLVFIKFMRFEMPGGHGSIQLLLGIVMWSFFVEATTQGMQAIVSRGDLIRKINFPKYIIIISGTLSALINMTLNFLVVLGFLIINGVDIKWTALLFPVYLLELYVFSLAVAFALAALYVKFRDIGHIWDVMLQGLFYATPILYPLSMVMQFSEQTAKILMVNPLAQIIQDARYNLVSHGVITINTLIANPVFRLIPFILVALTVIFAVYYFKKNQKYFAENV